MLRKLMKYELMATGRVYLPLFAALIVISIVNRLLSYLNTNTPQVIGVVIAVVLIVGIFVLTLVLTLQRFRQNLLSNEGYLMMTLPTRTNWLILSKMFVSAIWIVASFIVATISIMIMAMVSFNFRSLSDGFRVVSEFLGVTQAQFTTYVIEFIVLFIISLFSGILLLYTCMSLSMLVNKRRGLFTFGAFIVVTTAMQIIGSILAAIIGAMNISLYFNTNSLDAYGLSQLLIFILLGAEVIMCGAYYFVTRYMLKSRLNLQ